MSAALPSWLADPALGPVWLQIRERLERQDLEPRGHLVLTGLDRAGRHAVGNLLGRVVVTDRARVELPALDELVRHRTALPGLAAAAAAATGRPLVDRRAQRRTADAGRQVPYVRLREHLDAAGLVAPAWVDDWVRDVRASGLLVRTRVHPDVLVTAWRVLARLGPPVNRTDLAAEVTRDAHALDDGTALAQLVLRALGARSGAPFPASGPARRAMWEAHGVMLDAVSATCLTVGLRPAATTPAAARLRAAADSGDPVHVTAWDLRRGALGSLAERVVLVCENPRVLEAVCEVHGAGVPIVCANGQPNGVTLAVLSTLAEAGAVLRYHGDFDWPGVAIANRLLGQIGAQPWLMQVHDYLAGAQPGGLPLGGQWVEPAWDSELGAAMRHHGVAVHEEAVLAQLLAAVRTG